MALPEFKIAPSKMRFFLSERKLFQQVLAGVLFKSHQ